METVRPFVDWLNLLALGALLGAAGQLIRQIAGFKKLMEEKPGKALGSLLDNSRIVITLLIGAVAGMLAVLAMDLPPASDVVSVQTLMALLTAGYAGTDFVESFMKSHTTPKQEAIP